MVQQTSGPNFQTLKEMTDQVKRVVDSALRQIERDRAPYTTQDPAQDLIIELTLFAMGVENTENFVRALREADQSVLESVAQRLPDCCPVNVELARRSGAVVDWTVEKPGTLLVTFCEPIKYIHGTFILDPAPEDEG